MKWEIITVQMRMVQEGKKQDIKSLDISVQNFMEFTQMMAVGEIYVNTLSMTMLNKSTH